MGRAYTVAVWRYPKAMESVVSGHLELFIVPSTSKQQTNHNMSNTTTNNNTKNVIVEQYETEMKQAIEKYGEMNIECAPFYYKYGAAILDLVVSQADIFGKAVERAAEREETAMQEEDDEEEEEEDAEYEDSEEIEEEQEAGEEVGEEEEAVVSGKDEVVKEEEEESSDNADDLQIAWECLDTARVILTKESVQDKQLLAQVYYKLADHSMEIDNFETAQGDYERALDLYQELSSEMTREQASILYSLGLSFMFREDADGALTHFEKTLAAFKGLLEKLSLSESSSEEDVKYGKEYNDIIGELEERIESIRGAADEDRETAEEIKSLVNETVEELIKSSGLDNDFDSPSKENENEPVKDLGTLSSMKRKDVPEQPSAAEEINPSKTLRTESV